jgi:hypothetical protein
MFVSVSLHIPVCHEKNEVGRGIQSEVVVALVRKAFKV